MFFTQITAALHLSLFSATCIQSKLCHSFRSLLMLHSQLCLAFQVVITFGFPYQNPVCNYFLLHTTRKNIKSPVWISYIQLTHSLELWIKITVIFLFSYFRPGLTRSFYPVGLELKLFTYSDLSHACYMSCLFHYTSIHQSNNLHEQIEKRRL